LINRVSTVTHVCRRKLYQPCLVSRSLFITSCLQIYIPGSCLTVNIHLIGVYLSTKVKSTHVVKKNLSPYVNYQPSSARLGGGKTKTQCIGGQKTCKGLASNCVHIQRNLLDLGKEEGERRPHIPRFASCIKHV
jgi:hypothetical protein